MVDVADSISDARPRVGLMIPSSNTVMERDFQEGLASAAQVHSVRMYMEETTPEAEAKMLDEEAVPAARRIGTARPDVIVFGCTSAGALRGNEYDADLCHQLSQSTGVPVLSVIHSVREALRRFAGGRIAVITPYVDALNDRIRQSLEDEDLGVVLIAGLGITENFIIAEQRPAEIVDFVMHTIGDEELDALFVSCTNFRGVEARNDLESGLGIPVVTSNSAALDATRNALSL